ncbi:MAG: ATP-binding protein [Marinilabiliaceae bacterium]|nr:ATP-binding protein [Marinilabiliaceae bacterium]
MIKYLKVEGLNGNRSPFEFYFNEDINIFTGLNGCGKTTILKILWFVNCGYIEPLLEEIDFESLCLKSDNAEININQKENTYSVKTISENDIVEGELRNEKDFPFYSKKYSKLSSICFNLGIDSLFFPTFRRIEGGFSMDHIGAKIGSQSPIKESLLELSRALSSDKHQFISSVSTSDISSLLRKKYTEIIRQINDWQKEEFENIRQLIKKRKNSDSRDILASIESKISLVENKGNKAITPFSTLENLILRIFHKKGIKVDIIKFGDSSDAISSDKLSAGEKQMLSFLCYNAFSKSKVIFIDEPELSLHPDWQRLLISTLLKQGSNNQFFIATHSPFIYTKYPDKEIIIDADKGNENL